MAVNYMNIQQLRCIVEIARVGSITKAAENLYMNQPNLSRTVIEFEKVLMRIFPLVSMSQMVEF